MKTIGRIPGSLIVWLSSFAFFLVTLANNFSAAHDSIHYLDGIARGRDLFHQHHLLYHFLARQWLVFFQGIFVSAGTPEIIETYTAVWGSSSLTIVYLFYRNRFYLSPAMALLCTTLVAFSYGFWFYSVNVEVYMPPLFFILLGLYLLTAAELSNRDVWKIAIIHALAILFHQASLLFTPVVVYVLIKQYKGRGITKPLVMYALTGSAITVGLYVLIGWFGEGHDTVGAWWKWVRGYTVGHGYWQPLSLSTPLHVLTGFSHAFIGGHFVFQIPLLERYLQQSFQSHGLRDEVFLARNIPVAAAWLLAILTLVFTIMFLSLVIRFIRRYGIMKIHSKVLSPLVLCLLVYSVFFSFWMPEILEFWILQMVIVWLLLGGMLPLIRFPFGIRLRAGLLAMTSLLFLINFFGSILWMQRLDNDWYYRETSKVSRLITARDLVIVEDEWILKDYIRYYTQAKVVATDEEGFDKAATIRLVQQVVSANGKVYLYRISDSSGQDGRWTLIRSY